MSIIILSNQYIIARFTGESFEYTSYYVKHLFSDFNFFGRPFNFYINPDNSLLLNKGKDNPISSFSTMAWMPYFLLTTYTTFIHILKKSSPYPILAIYIFIFKHINDFFTTPLFLIILITYLIENNNSNNRNNLNLKKN